MVTITITVATWSCVFINHVAEWFNDMAHVPRGHVTTC